MPSNKNLNQGFDKMNNLQHLQNIERKNSKMISNSHNYEQNVLYAKINHKVHLDDIIENRIEEANEVQRQMAVMRQE